MPGRIIPLVSGETYHVFNRGVDLRPTFTDKREYTRALDTLNYYRFRKLPVKLSRYLIFSVDLRDKIIKDLYKQNRYLIKFYAYCFMPNHFHFLMMQLEDNGVSKFMSNFQNSYTRYFNTRHKRIGNLLLDQFRAVRIQTDEQLLHVSRYIHLNPLTSFVIKKKENLESYLWTSLTEYMGDLQRKICDTGLVLSFFKSPAKYKKFLLDQVDYQRELDRIKHLLIE